MAGTDTVSTGSSTFEGAASRIFELNEKLIEMVKESGKTSLDTYEKASQSLLDLEKAAASSSQLDWVNALADTHAKFVQDVTSSYLKVAREALR